MAHSFPAEDAETVVMHPGGHLIACLCRSQVFEMALQEGPVLRRAAGCVALEYLHSGRVVTITDDPKWRLTSLSPDALYTHCLLLPEQG